MTLWQTATIPQAKAFGDAAMPESGRLIQLTRDAERGRWRG